MKALLFFLLTFLALAGYSQNARVNAIQWNVTEATSSSGQAMSGAGDKLKVYPNDRIEWSDSDNNIKFSFSVASIIGDWTNVNDGGLIHYNFEMEGQPGEVIIQRSGGGIRAEIQLYKVDANPLVYTLVIQDYSIL